jgi:hypothetical protein
MRCSADAGDYFASLHAHHCLRCYCGMQLRLRCLLTSRRSSGDSNVGRSRRRRPWRSQSINDRCAGATRRSQRRALERATFCRCFSSIDRSSLGRHLRTREAAGRRAGRCEHRGTSAREERRVRVAHGDRMHAHACDRRFLLLRSEATVHVDARERPMCRLRGRSP